MQTVPSTTVQTQVQVNRFIRSGYNWMAVGLALTGIVAFFVSSNEQLFRIVFGNWILFLGLIIGQLALVFTLSARVHKMQAATATSLFILYAALNGLVFASLVLIYTSASIASTFFVCAATFVACSLYGMATQRDLTSLGGFMTMGLIGIVIASVVNLFLRSSGMSIIISYIGGFIFIGLTACDTQKIKTWHSHSLTDWRPGLSARGPSSAH